MAGQPGRSGGARPGAGRKPKKKAEDAPQNNQMDGLDEPVNVLNDGIERDPLDFLLAVQNDKYVDPRLRVRAAIAAAQYKHTKLHDGGKKEEKEKAAKKAAGGKFASSEPPKLAAVGGKKV